ncbi:MAG: hypothetical protein ACD_77C00143G0014 [uncultured bacterium]|nr:MAG: hypothetical protein ACD_77C00143G0014 [uncultured bacterium]HBY01417.1 peptidase M28 [Rikenellaceae bacterium]
MFIKNHSIYLLSVLLVLSCTSESEKLESALQSISVQDIQARIETLASDDFAGRAPSTPGEVKTINYLAQQFKEIGLKPGNGESYFQEVSLIKIYADKSMVFNISNGKKKLSPEFAKEFIGGTPQIGDYIMVDNSEIVFVGYGINAPEYGWNDYEGLDVKGKTVLMLINDPGYATSDSTLFEGRTMSLYGRWTYKFEEAARQGATAAIIIHETGAAAYPWGVVQNSWYDSKLYLEDNMFLKSDLQLQSWVTTECAQKLFDLAGVNYNEISVSASKRGFKPVKMNVTASVSIKNKVEYAKSNNVAAVWPGKDKSDEYLIYTAHWDHFGVNPAFEGDSVLNGAVDNATGTAALLEIAEAFTKLAKQQDRSVLFLAVTCEEQGLLGSEFYAKNPLFPLEKTVGVVNIDALNILGKTKDMTITGMGKSNLDHYAVSVLEKYGRYAAPDPMPEKGGYFRSDHISFVNAGVQALYLSRGVDNVEHGKKWGMEQTEKWIVENYHKPSDNYEPEKWDFEGMIEDLKIYFEVGYLISNAK